MFVGIDPRRKTVIRWATPALFAGLWLAYVLGAMRAPALRRRERDWGALSGVLDSLQAWRQAWAEARVAAVLPGSSREWRNCSATWCSAIFWLRKSG